MLYAGLKEGLLFHGNVGVRSFSAACEGMPWSESFFRDSNSKILMRLISMGESIMLRTTPRRTAGTRTGGHHGMDRTRF
jgi:hypothetical protein